MPKRSPNIERWVKHYADCGRYELLAELQKWVPDSDRHKGAAIALDMLDHSYGPLMCEKPYETIKRLNKEREEGATLARESMLKMERERKEETEQKEERRHRELVESMKKNNGIHISSGGDTNISGSNLAGRDMPTPSNSSTPHRGKVVIKWAFGILATIIGGLIVAYMKGCFPALLK